MAAMQDATAIERIAIRFRDLSPLMDERMRRQWAALEAAAYGWGADSGGVASDQHVAHHDSQRLGGVAGAKSFAIQSWWRAAFVGPAVVANVKLLPIRG